jgi:hypothetical protein
MGRQGIKAEVAPEAQQLVPAAGTAEGLGSRIQPGCCGMRSLRYTTRLDLKLSNTPHQIVMEKAFLNFLNREAIGLRDLIKSHLFFAYYLLSRFCLEKARIISL